MHKSRPVEQVPAQTGSYLEEISAPCEGYFFLSLLDPASQAKIGELQADMMKFFSPDDIYLPQGDQLHVTVRHLVSPDVVYNRKPSELFDCLKDEAITTMDFIADNTSPFSISFNELILFPDAGTLIMKGRDDGSMQRIRSTIEDSLQLPEGTRSAPEIIHSTLLRFRNCKDIEGLKTYLDEHEFNVDNEVDAVQLVKEIKIFTQEFDVLNSFQLKKGTK